MIKVGAGNANATGLCHCLKPRCDVDAVSIDIVALNYDVAEVDANAQLDPVRSCGVDPLCHGSLDIGGTFHCIDHAAKFDESTISHELNDATVESCDRRFDNFCPAGFQPLK